jgi:hypothetical protein
LLVQNLILALGGGAGAASGPHREPESHLLSPAPHHRRGFEPRCQCAAPSLRAGGRVGDGPAVWPSADVAGRPRRPRVRPEGTIVCRCQRSPGCARSWSSVRSPWR